MPKKGYKQSMEHRNNTSKAMKNSRRGIPLTDNVKQKMSISHTNLKPSKETRQKMSDSRIGRYCGENNPNWCGGISGEPYCWKFNEKKKEEIRIRDNRICQECNKTEKENGEKLSVHHIHYDKPNCEPDLISLCHKCNIKANFNRDYWEEKFIIKLKNKGVK